MRTISLLIGLLGLTIPAGAEVCGQAPDNASFAPGVARLSAKEFHDYIDGKSMRRFMADVSSPEVQGRFEMNLLVDEGGKVTDVDLLSGPDDARARIADSIHLIEVKPEIEGPIVGRLCYEAVVHGLSRP